VGSNPASATSQFKDDMATRYFLSRPSPTSYVVWDGTNVQEIIDAGSIYIPPTIVDNEDGTLTVNGNTAVIGQFVSALGQVVDEAYLEEYFQEIASDDLTYVLE
jgi:hypothetical protein